MSIHSNIAYEDPNTDLPEDRKAFDRALVQELPDLRYYALSLTRNRADAEDLVQDCVLRALSRRHMFQPGTHARRWLFTILRNIHVDNCRRPRNRRAHLEIDDHLDAVPQPPSQDHWMRVVELRRAMRRMRRHEREILVLSAFSRLDQRQIARRLNLAEGTVRSRLSRARAILEANGATAGAAA